MISPIEFKRRLTWLWRLSCSRLSEYIVEDGCVSALWVFDTAHQPDGGVLRPCMEEVARREGLRLRSFGPRRAVFSERVYRIAEFVSRLSCVLRADFDAEFARRVSDQIVTAFADERPSVLLVGASKGTFATIASNVDPSLKVWEVQHGLLDPSYFPMNVQQFYARSRVSAHLIEEFAPHVNVKTLCRSLDPPEGYVGVADLCLVRELVCYSKNPGGGCTTEDLAMFEQACYSAARRINSRFSLKLHPRDSVLKLLWRHRQLRVLGWVHKPGVRPCAQPRLVISAYSSALITESCKDDLIINAMIGKPSEITRREYQWVPTVSVAAINTLSGTSHAFIRTR
jgi:hypothetical protein